MFKKTAFAGLVLAFGFLMPLYAMAEGTPTTDTSPTPNPAPIGTLNPNNMGQTDMSNPNVISPGATYTGTESIRGNDPARGNGHYDMSGTGVNDRNGMNTIRTNNYRTTATDDNGNNWGWLGLLGLLGLAGMFGRNRDDRRDPV